MKTFVWLLVVVGVVNCGTIAYPGRSALLAYNPARGEFPVQSLFGRGYFSYIDENGNSRIVTLEANPLLGVRVGADGQPQIEIGRSVDLEKKKGTPSKKYDGLKPIKEFDENPFLDSVDASTSAPVVLKDVTKEALVAESMPAIMYLPPTVPEGVVPSPNSVPDSANDGSNDLLFSTPMQPIGVPGQQGQTIMYLPPAEGKAVVPGQNIPNLVPSSLDASAPKVPLLSMPMQPVAIPEQQGPTIMYLPPAEGKAVVPGQNIPNSAPKVPLLSMPMQSVGIPAQQGPTIMYLPPAEGKAVVPGQNIPNSAPKVPLLSMPMQSGGIPAQQGPTIMYLPPGAVPDGTVPMQFISSSPKDVSNNVPTPMQPSIIPEEGQVIMYLPPAKPETIVPRQLFSNPSPPVGTSGQGTFNPTNPFLSSTAGSNPSSATNSGTASSNPSPPACVFPNPSPPSDIVFPNSPIVAGSGVFSSPVSPVTESPYQPGGPQTIRPTPTVFPNPPPPAPTQGVFPNPKPPVMNPFISQGSPSLPSSVAPLIPLDPFIPNVNNPFLPNLLLDVRVDEKTRSLLKRLQRLLESTNPELVIDTPEVEQAKRAHFLAHKLALARLEDAHQQDDSHNNDHEDESPIGSASDSSSVYLAPDGAASQAVTSGPSTVEITEQTNVAAAGTGSEDVSQALPVV